jgi:F-type H+-transporting ATPase subunit b
MSIFGDAEFWVLAGFVIFFGLLGNTGWKLMKGALDGRTAKVREQLAEATRLRTEAESLLAAARAKQDQAVRDAADIVAAANDEAERMRKEGEEELRRTLSARQSQALDRIALAEQAAVQSVKVRAVEIATRAATELVREALDGQASGLLIDQAIEELPRRARA